MQGLIDDGILIIAMLCNCVYVKQLRYFYLVTLKECVKDYYNNLYHYKSSIFYNIYPNNFIFCIIIYKHIILDFVGRNFEILWIAIVIDYQSSVIINSHIYYLFYLAMCKQTSAFYALRSYSHYKVESLYSTLYISICLLYIIY